jgi:hypothetical protein
MRAYVRKSMKSGVSMVKLKSFGGNLTPQRAGRVLYKAARQSNMALRRRALVTLQRLSSKQRRSWNATPKVQQIYERDVLTKTRMKSKRVKMMSKAKKKSKMTRSLIKTELFLQDLKTTLSD